MIPAETLHIPSSCRGALCGELLNPEDPLVPVAPEAAATCGTCLKVAAEQRLVPVADYCVSAEKARRLAAQWPKRCACGRSYRAPGSQVTPVESLWESLPLAKSPNGPSGSYRDAYATHQMRNCHCGSTLVVLTEIHDLEAE